MDDKTNLAQAIEILSKLKAGNFGAGGEDPMASYDWAGMANSLGTPRTLTPFDFQQQKPGVVPGMGKGTAPISDPEKAISFVSGINGANRGESLGAMIPKANMGGRTRLSPGVYRGESGGLVDNQGKPIKSLRGGGR